MKLGWVLAIIGGGYLLFRLCYAVAWGFCSTSLTSWSDAISMAGYAVLVGGIPLVVGIWLIKRKRKVIAKEV